MCIIKSESANWELLSISKIVCDETEVTLVIDNVPVGYESIVWSDGSSGNVELEIIPDRDNPEYSVTIVDDEGCIETQKIILEFVSIEERITVETNKKDYVKVNGLLHMDKMFYCSDWIQPLKLSIDEVKPERGDYNYLWSTGETTSSILVHPPFDENPYSVEVSDFCRTHEEIFSAVNIECPCPGDPILDSTFAPTTAGRLYGATFGCTRDNVENCPEDQIESVTVDGVTIRYDRRHEGIDISSPIDSPTHAMIAGRVLVHRSNCNCDENYFDTCTNFCGNSVQITNEDGSIGYCHLSKIFVNTGDDVRLGEIIGTSGITGNACDENINPHLHITYTVNGVRQDPGTLMCNIDYPSNTE